MGIEGRDFSEIGNPEQLAAGDLVLISRTLVIGAEDQRHVPTHPAQLEHYKEVGKDAANQPLTLAGHILAAPGRIGINGLRSGLLVNRLPSQQEPTPTYALPIPEVFGISTGSFGTFRYPVEQQFFRAEP